MTRAFQFDVDRVTEQLDRILQMELAGVIYHALLLHGLWSRAHTDHRLVTRATESLTHAQEAGEMIMRLHRETSSRHRVAADNATILSTRSWLNRFSAKRPGWSSRAPRLVKDSPSCLRNMHPNGRGRNRAFARWSSC